MKLRKILIISFVILSLAFSSTVVNAYHWFWEYSYRAYTLRLTPVDNASFEMYPDEPAYIGFTMDKLLTALVNNRLVSPDMAELKFNGNCTREEFFVIIGQTFSIQGDDSKKLHEFSDADEISDEAKPYVCGLLDVGVIIGNDDGTLAPKKTLSAAESVVISIRLIDCYSKRTLVDKRLFEGAKTAKNISVSVIEYDDTTGIACAGKKLEPAYPLSEPSDYVKPQIVYVHSEILSFSKGIYRLTMNNEDLILDGRAEYWIYWESSDGTFEELSEDCRSVVFCAGLNTENRNAVPTVVVSDSFGNRHKLSIKGLKGNY